MQHYGVLIVGGGVVGSATAYYLQKHGFAGSIGIVEKDRSFQFGCTARSAGGIRQQFSTPENIELSKFGLRLMRGLKEEFGPEADVSFREQGYLILASEKGLKVLEENHRIQIAHGAENVVLVGEALAARFPWLRMEGIAAGCFGFAGEGWLDPYSLMNLFRKTAMLRGVSLLQGEVVSIHRGPDRVHSVGLTDGTALYCDHLVNAAGAGAGALAKLAGIRLPVGPRKRYVYVLDCPAADEALHQGPLTVDPSGVYFRPEGQHFICGLSPEHAEEPEILDWEVDYSWFEDRIWPILAERVAAFEAVKVINAWVGHYDYNSFDHNAVIGRHPILSNFYFANGYSGHGLQQGPGSGNAIAELIVHGVFHSIDLARLGYGRIMRKAPLFERNII